MADDAFAGVVLTGGRSSRMGRDKALLRVEGMPMAQRVAQALFDAGATDVVCIGGDEAALRAIGLLVLADEHPGEGPLAGFVTGLAWSPQPITVVAPCDLRTPHASSFRALVDALAARDVGAAVPIVDGAWRALPAALRTARAPEITRCFDLGERAFHRAIEALTRIEVDAGPLDDADTPEEVPDHR